MSSALPLKESGSLYLQIAEMLEESILIGKISEESRAPSTNELAKLYSINPATAAKGIAILVDDGILYKRRGLGMYVANGAREIIRVKRRKAFYKNFAKPLALEARTLRLTDADLSVMVQKALDETDRELAADV